MKISRRSVLAKGLTTSLVLWTGSRTQSAGVRIGYTISKTGPYATGAGITTLPNYRLWVEEVNAAGGLRLATGRARISVV